MHAESQGVHEAHSRGTTIGVGILAAPNERFQLFGSNSQPQRTTRQTNAQTHKLNINSRLQFWGQVFVDDVVHAGAVLLDSVIQRTLGGTRRGSPRGYDLLDGGLEERVLDYTHDDVDESLRLRQRRHAIYEGSLDRLGDLRLLLRGRLIQPLILAGGNGVDGAAKT